MKKFFLFAAALISSLSMMAADGSYSVMTVNGDTTVWNFGAATTGSSQKIQSGTVDNGILFINSALGDQQLASSGGLSNKKTSEIWVPVSTATAAGTISITTYSASDGRWLQLYVDNEEASEDKRLWSKYAETATTTKGPQSFEFNATDLTASSENGYYLKLLSNNTEMKIATITVVESGPTPTDVATLKEIKVNGNPIAFDPTVFDYSMTLSYGTTVVPTVTATPTLANESVVIKAATSLPDTTFIEVTSADETVTNTYFIAFTVSSIVPDVNTLASLSIDGKEVADFDPLTTEYAYEVPFTQTALPVVTAEPDDELATVIIDQVTALPGEATVVVTAQNGDMKTYTINFTQAAALKEVKEVKMDNGYYAWKSEGDATNTLHAYYLAGQTAPEVESAIVSEGASWAVEDNMFKVTGADATVAEFPLEIEAVEPLAFTADTLVMDGTETWIKGGYGFDASKKWRFSKTDTDYSREIAGKTHIELFLPACDSISLKESCGQARAFRLYINGVAFGDKYTQVKNGWSTFNVAQSAPFMLTIMSAQTGGDGGFGEVVLFGSDPTGVATNAAALKATKMVENGKVVILRGGVRYNMTGARL